MPRGWGAGMVGIGWWVVGSAVQMPKVIFPPPIPQKLIALPRLLSRCLVRAADSATVGDTHLFFLRALQKFGVAGLPSLILFLVVPYADHLILLPFFALVIGDGKKYILYYI